MLLKLRDRPERRLQAVPAPTIRIGVIPSTPWSWHRLQARREHDACATEVRMPFLAARRSDVAPPEASRRMAPSTRGVFVCWRSWKRGAQGRPIASQRHGQSKPLIEDLGSEPGHVDEPVRRETGTTYRGKSL